MLTKALQQSLWCINASRKLKVTPRKVQNLLQIGFKSCTSFSLARMATNEDLERVKARAEKTEAILAQLESQIEMIRQAAVKKAGLGEEEKLTKENAELKQEIESLRRALILAEIGNGVRQVQLPTKGAVSAICSSLASESAAAAAPVVNGTCTTEQTPAPKQQKGKGEAAGKKMKAAEQPEAGGKKAKVEKGAAAKSNKGAAAAGGDAEGPMDISRLDLRIGKIVGVEKHPDADTLYVEQVDLGEGKIRTIVSGLVKHVPINAMKDRIAVFMCNLKPVKMRGIFSEGMIMCASGPEKTEILVPPTDSVVGDRVYVAEYKGTPDVQLNPKKKIWETLKPDVRTNHERVATYKGAPFVIEGKGFVVAPTLTDAQIS